MCARLLACPLCSQPGFLTLDALRAGLVSVATRPLACPVCNDVLLGIDKLTIHLFGHTISNPSGTDASKLIELRNAQQQLHSWSVIDTKRADEPTSGIYIPIDEIEAFRTALKDAPQTGTQTIGTDIKAPGQVIFLQAQPKIFSANVIGHSSAEQQQQHDQVASGNAYPSAASGSAANPAASISITTKPREEGQSSADVVITVNGVLDKDIADESFSQTTWANSEKSENAPAAVTSEETQEFSASHTDRLADLVKNAQITASPLGSFHEAFDCSKPSSPAAVASEPEPTPAPSTSSTTTINLEESDPSERCNICGLNFPEQTILLLHKQLVHTAPSGEHLKNYPCHLCTKVFKMRGSLMVHMRVAHSSVNAPVRVTREHARQHLREHLKEHSGELDSESPENEFGHNCPTCGKHFKKQQHVIQHLKIHDGKQYECEVCSKMFTTKYFLKKHKRLHSGEMPYRCNLCDKTFTFQQSYHKHRLYHKDDKPHTCLTCGRSFKELSTLHNHERIHTGEKPFACETCGKCFRQRVSYLVHRRIHTGVMPYKCTACGKNFRYKVSQRTHKCSQQSPGSFVQQPGAFTQNSQDSSEGRDKHESSSRKEQARDKSLTNEDSQFISIINEEVPNTLKRKSNLESANDQNVNKNIALESKDSTNDSNDFIERLWNKDSPTTEHGIEYKERKSKPDAILDSIINNDTWNNSTNTKDRSEISKDSVSKHFMGKEVNTQFTNGLWCETLTNDMIYHKSLDKNQLNNTNDFFSMVMSPLENEVSSPSTEMEHLRLSSPVNNQEHSSIDVGNCFPTLNNSPSAVQVDCNSIEENFQGNGGNLSTLQTINEDSLKELLYSIVDK